MQKKANQDFVKKNRLISVQQQLWEDAKAALHPNATPEALSSLRLNQILGELLEFWHAHSNKVSNALPIICMCMQCIGWD